MKTLLETLNLSASFLESKGVSLPRREAEYLLSYVLGVARLDLYLQFERPLTENELDKLRLSLIRRAQREPIQYIEGRVQFCGLNFEINPDVLIPRPETEILVEQISSQLEKRYLEGKVLWDMCTGSGCIGITLKKRFPELSVVGSDISEKAVETARCNSVLNGVDVLYRRGDLFVPFQGERCDFFVANPPYVSEDEFATLSPEVRLHEPKHALVGGETGLEFYKKIASNIGDFLSNSGSLWLEIGSAQGEDVKKIFSSYGYYKTHILPDWAGHDRFFSLDKD